MSSNQSTSRYPIKHSSSVKIMTLKKKSTTTSLNKGTQSRTNNDSETIMLRPTNYEMGSSKVATKNDDSKGSPQRTGNSSCTYSQKTDNSCSYSQRTVNSCTYSQKKDNSCTYSQKTGNICPPLHKTGNTPAPLQKPGITFSQYSKNIEHHQSPKIVGDGSSDKKWQSK